MEMLQGNKKHIEACLSIAKSLTQYFTDDAITRMAENLPEQLLYIAIDSDQLQAFAAIQSKTDQVAEISWIAVKPERQHQGIGSALINHIVHDLRSQAIKLLEVKTLSASANYPPYEIIRQFYEKMGFLHLETIDPYPGWEPGNPCAIYVKIINAGSDN